MEESIIDNVDLTRQHEWIIVSKPFHFDSCVRTTGFNFKFHGDAPREMVESIRRNLKNVEDKDWNVNSLCIHENAFQTVFTALGPLPTCTEGNRKGAQTSRKNPQGYYSPDWFLYLVY
jgi:hypothetical protein